LDIGIAGDRITAIDAKLPRETAKKVLDIRGCYVTPGLIDFRFEPVNFFNPPVNRTMTVP
jgi:dihydroorotase-like cyclic amidohydrolase